MTARIAHKETVPMAEASQPVRYRTIWISDVHLGTHACRADLLLDFLGRTESETLYLVGDIIDCWKLKGSWYWPSSHNDVIQCLLAKARNGSKVVFLPGNHDEPARDFLGLQFGGIEIVDTLVHTTADGRRLLVIHGDQFDVVVVQARWLALVGDWAYRVLLVANTLFNWVRRRLGFSYWSLSAYLKRKAKQAVEFLGRFESALAGEAVRQGCDGVVCGHVHTAELRQIGSVTYYNDGDWVESCTALVEHDDGTMEILYWAAEADPLTAGRNASATKAVA